MLYNSHGCFIINSTLYTNYIHSSVIYAKMLFAITLQKIAKSQEKVVLESKGDYKEYSTVTH